MLKEGDLVQVTAAHEGLPVDGHSIRVTAVDTRECHGYYIHPHSEYGGGPGSSIYFFPDKVRKV